MKKLIDIPSAKCPIHGEEMYITSIHNEMVSIPTRGLKTTVYYQCVCCDSEFRYEVFTQLNEDDTVDFKQYPEIFPYAHIYLKNRQGLPTD